MDDCLVKLVEGLKEVNAGKNSKRFDIKEKKNC